MAKAAEEKASKSAGQTRAEVSTNRKPGYKEQRALEARQRELAELPGRIEALEAEQHLLAEAMADASFYQRKAFEISQTINRLKELEDELARVYQRWEELENS